MHRIETTGGTLTLHSMNGAVQSIELDPQHGGTLLVQLGPDWKNGDALDLRVESADSYVVEFSPVQFRMRLELPVTPEPGDARFEATSAGQVAWYRFRFVDGRMEQTGPRVVLRD